jgi:hypothetical protein
MRRVQIGMVKKSVELKDVYDVFLFKVGEILAESKLAASTIS